MTTDSGYSGTPLVRKLGFKSGWRVSVIAAPDGYLDWLQALPDGLLWTTEPDSATQLVHRFVTQRAELATDLQRWRGALRPDVLLWISWPKRSSGQLTDITEDVIRAECLPLGWVDVKVCAVNAVWSGLKLVIRKDLR